MQKENQNLVLTALVSFTLGLLVAFASIMIATSLVKPCHHPDRFQPRMEMRMHRARPHMNMDKRGPEGRMPMEMDKHGPKGHEPMGMDRHPPKGHEPMGMEQGKPQGMVPPPPKGEVVIVKKTVPPMEKPMPKKDMKK